MKVTPEDTPYAANLANLAQASELCKAGNLQRFVQKSHGSKYHLGMKISCQTCALGPGLFR